MARIKRGETSHAKHRKLLASAKGYMMTRRRLVRKAKEAVLHAGAYAYAGRKNKKRNFRRNWILHINEAVKPHGLTYSTFIHKLSNANVQLDRKILAEIATQHRELYQSIIDKIQ